MARYLYVLGGIVRNVVEHAGVPPELGDGGEDVVPDPGFTNVGAAYDITTDIRERRVGQLESDRVLKVVMQELFRLTNEVRVLRGLGAITALQYRNAVKALY